MPLVISRTFGRTAFAIHLHKVAKFKESAILIFIIYFLIFSIIIHLHDLFKNTQPGSRNLQFLIFVIYFLIFSIVIHLHDLFKNTQPSSRNLQFLIFVIYFKIFSIVIHLHDLF